MQLFLAVVIVSGFVVIASIFVISVAVIVDADVVVGADVVVVDTDDSAFSILLQFTDPKQQTSPSSYNADIYLIILVICSKPPTGKTL